MPIADFGFTEPDWYKTLDVDHALKKVPSDAVIKGVLAKGIIKRLSERSLRLPEGSDLQQNYAVFKDYPLTDFMRLLLATTAVLSPGRPVRKGLWELGRLAYPSFKESLMGSILFAMVGSDPKDVLSLATKAYGMSTNHGLVELQQQEGKQALLHFKDIHSFIDCYHVGIVQGVLDVCGRHGKVRVRSITSTEAHILVEWT